MPLKGEYEPDPTQFVRDQVELHESSGGTQGTTLSVLVATPEEDKLRDLPVVILTTLGAKSGKIRKSPVMRVEHDGSYAVVASMAGAPHTRSGTTTTMPSTRRRPAARSRSSSWSRRPSRTDAAQPVQSTDLRRDSGRPEIPQERPYLDEARLTGWA